MSKKSDATLSARSLKSNDKSMTKGSSKSNTDHDDLLASSVSSSPSSCAAVSAPAQASSSSHSSANERWKFLKEAIVFKNTSFLNSKVSVRRFDSFGFLKTVKIAYTPTSNAATRTPRSSSSLSNKPSARYNYHRQDDDDDDNDIHFASRDDAHRSRTPNRANEDNYQWYNISIPSVDSKLSVIVRLGQGQINLSTLTGFNNTGNVCIWPSEELMAVFCAKNSYIFDDKSVCELGGGMTCLAGLMISKMSQAKEVFLTDGNEASFENLEVICSQNEFESSVECCLLQWNKNTDYGDLEKRFDYIICADCLFFDDYREDLCMTIYKLLRMDGTCLIFAPNRQNTFHKFIDLARPYFECMIVNEYDMEAWEKHLHEKESNPNYDEDIHYPLLLKLKKRARANNDSCKMVF